MAQCLVLKQDLSRAGMFRGFVNSVISDDQEYTEDDRELGWVVKLQGKSVDAANELLKPLERVAVAGEPNYDAPDEEDRIVFISPRRWYFAFDEIQLNTLNTYGGITLLPGDAEATIKQTQSGGLFKFGD